MLSDLHGPATAQPEGFLVRDLLRFFMVDVILIIGLRLFLFLGLFSDPNAYVLGILATKVILLAYILWIVRDRRDAWPETGGATAGRWWAWPAGLALYAAAYPITIQINKLNHQLMIHLHNWFGWHYAREPQDVMILIFENILENPVRILLVFFTVVAGPFMEELAFRGIGMDAFRRRRGLIWALFWTSILFGLYHFRLDLLLPLSFLGLVFGAARAMSRSLWCAVCIHCLHNAVAIYIMARELGLSRQYLGI